MSKSIYKHAEEEIVEKVIKPRIRQILAEGVSSKQALLEDYNARWADQNPVSLATMNRWLKMTVFEQVFQNKLVYKLDPPPPNNRTQYKPQPELKMNDKPDIIHDEPEITKLSPEEEEALQKFMAEANMNS